MSAHQTNLLTDLSTIVTRDLSFSGFLTNFHFIRPWWLLAFLALFLLLFLLKKIRYYQSPWQHFLPAHLASTLLENAQSDSTQVVTRSNSGYWLKPLLIGCCVIIALAGPAWQKLPQPVFQLERGAVLIMDMSYSMYATDVKPNRLTRARYKAVDLLGKINEGDIGLIAYAGDAFIISPLTQDVKNIELLLPSLSPDIMPVPGANALAALHLADKTLKNAGHISGDIYWFTDDIDNEEMSDVYAWSEQNNHHVNILGVGSDNGAPIKLSSGKLLKDDKGAIIIPRLPAKKLAAITKRSSGVYRTLSNDDSDIRALTSHLSAELDDEFNENNLQDEQVMQGDKYQEQGPWLLLIILPLMLSYFRRGSGILSIVWILPLTLMMTVMTISSPVYAQTSDIATTDKSQGANISTATKLWRDLWQTSDQQGQQHYQQKEYQKAAEQFDDSQWQGSAHYKAGNYEQALAAFKQSDSAQSLYNQGNSLAQLQKIDEAIDSYKRALDKDPSLTEAKDNLAKLEALKQQQQQQQQSQDNQQDQQDQQDQQNSDQQSQGDKQENRQEQNSQQQADDGQQVEQEQQGQSSQEHQSAEQQDEQKRQDEDANQAKQSEQSEQEQESAEEKSLAQKASDNKAQETQQKHKQLLNKVTDDPYLLLRNKMRLEYQKRRHDGASEGDKKKW